MLKKEGNNFAIVVADLKRSQSSRVRPALPKKPPKPRLSTKPIYQTTSDHENITLECLKFISQVHYALICIKNIKEELMKKFSGDNDIIKRVTTTFREIEPLKSAYEIILDKIKQLESNRSTKLYLYHIFLDPTVSHLLKLYKPFLIQYSENDKWIHDFYNNNESFQMICDESFKTSEHIDNGSLISYFYTVFNSLFCFELIFDRYSQGFDESSDHSQKIKEVKAIISSILSVVNTSHNQEDILLAQNELNLLTDRSKETKINVRFIYKGLVTKFARRNDKHLSRQLVLFSDCLYVTSLPGNIFETSCVKQELSVHNMKVSEIPREDSLCVSHLTWGLTIGTREAVQDFYFDNEETMKIWKDKLLNVIKEHDHDDDPSSPNADNNLNSLGKEAPRWQKDLAAGICNGYHCSQRFNTTARRHHCRSDGLLYCDLCCNFKIKLIFERKPESRVCELCYNILHLSDLELLEKSSTQLKEVIDRKTRSGMKMGWLFIKLFDEEKKVFLLQLKYYCELKHDKASLNFYERPEDKCHYKCLELAGVKVVSKYSWTCDGSTLSSKEFILQDVNNKQEYYITALDEGDCRRWIECLQETINHNLHTYIESDEDFESDEDC